jgi:hypothetical protein
VLYLDLAHCSIDQCGTIGHRAISLDQVFDDGNSLSVYEPAGGRPDPEEAYRREQMRAIIGQLAAELSPPQRNAFRLLTLEGFTIRGALGLKMASARSESSLPFTSRFVAIAAVSASLPMASYVRSFLGLGR